MQIEQNKEEKQFNEKCQAVLVLIFFLREGWIKGPGAGLCRMGRAEEAAGRGFGIDEVISSIDSAGRLRGFLRLGFLEEDFWVETGGKPMGSDWRAELRALRLVAVRGGGMVVVDDVVGTRGGMRSGRGLEAAAEWISGGARIRPREAAFPDRPSESDSSSLVPSISPSRSLDRRFGIGLATIDCTGPSSIENGSSRRDPITDIMWFSIIRLSIYQQKKKKNMNSQVPIERKFGAFIPHHSE